MLPMASEYQKFFLLEFEISGGIYKCLENNYYVRVEKKEYYYSPQVKQGDYNSRK